jgi:hypothetical protein
MIAHAFDAASRRACGGSNRARQPPPRYLEQVDGGVERVRGDHQPMVLED